MRRAPPPVPYAAITALLGGRTTVGRSLASAADLVACVREGLPYESLEAVARRLDLSVDATGSALGLSRRTVARRRHEGRLDAIESEKIARLARVLARAEEVLGSGEKARRWAHRPNRALGGASPLSLLDADIGAELAFEVLGRIDHGIVS
jgi:putative toxin-antitoxin system antitoxin component (TIGR02293 family)